MSVLKIFSIRFPHVSSSIPVTPPKPPSRPRTAPEIPCRNQSSRKSSRATRTDLPVINENLEKEPVSNIESNVIQPTTIDVQRDVQILTLDDTTYPTQQLLHESNEQIPF